MRTTKKTDVGIVYKHINKCQITNWKRGQMDLAGRSLL